MGALVWLLIPLFAGIGAGLWGSWANRTHGVRGDGPELDGYARFRAAMERPSVLLEGPAATGDPAAVGDPAAPGKPAVPETPSMPEPQDVARERSPSGT
ncbi:hypothetical protein ACL02U_28040 [Streptomyces sp. MS06]|uniref:hypothetical protein n=1 Tax=Streptomyces sp. MS06 TaxID=3385974 RepID=UPI0039A2EF48